MSKFTPSNLLFTVVFAVSLAGSASVAIAANNTPTDEPTPDCSDKAIIHYANRAPSAFEYEKHGSLYGVRTHTAATRVADMPGYNSCALVAHAILRKAGCKWATRTANAKSVYDMAYRNGWRPSDTPKGGCLVAWNSISPGKLPRIGRGLSKAQSSSGGVDYRHVGIMTDAWWSVDNTSFLSRPSAGLAIRPIRYEMPIYLCPRAKQ